MPSRIERASALPLDLMVDDAVFEIELAEIWKRDWVFATTVDAVAEPGEFVSVTIGRQSVIVVRGEDYLLRAHANVCSHRGASLVECDGRASRFSCPYHGWTYDLEGDLVSVPYAQPDEISHAEHRLDQFHVSQWHGLVFVSLHADPEPLDEWLAAIDPYVRPLGFQRLHHDVAGVAVEEWNANWKAIFANAIDSYSHFRVHAETIEPVSPTDASYYLAGSARATITGGESGDRADHLVIAIPPSLVAIVYPDALLWQAFTPVAVNRTRVTIGVASENPIEHGTSVNLPGWDAGFIDEDRQICERMQRNGHSHSRPGPLLEIERALGDFNDYLGWRLAGQEPDPPTVAAPPGERPEPPIP